MIVAVYRAGGLMPGTYVVGIITTQSTIPVALGEAYADAVAQAPDPIDHRRCVGIS